MKTFKGTKKLGDILVIANEKGFTVDTNDFGQGSDWIWLRDLENRKLQVIFNTFNGHFAVYSLTSGKPIATHLSSSLDSETWYNELLGMFYEEVA